jgi:hypothetical protein
VPFGTADGQFMFATVVMQGAGVGSDFIQVPTGWTELAQTGCGTDYRQSISYRIASGDVWPTSAYIWNFCTSSTSCPGANSVNVYGTGSIVNFADVSTTSPIQTGTGAPECNCGFGTTATANGLTPTIANSLVIAQDGAVGNVSLSAPVGLTNIFVHGNSIGPDNRNSWGVLPASPTGAVSSNYGTGSASDNVGCLISVNPGP